MHGRRLTQKEFVERGSEVHGELYTYSEIYVHSQVKLTIICPKHGEFKQEPGEHLIGRGCPKCKGSLVVAKSLGLSLVEYYQLHNKGLHYCKHHGIQELKWYYINGRNGKTTYQCKKCLAGRHKNSPYKEPKKPKSPEIFVIKANRIHEGKYTYPEQYRGSQVKITILCPEHGEFRQVPGAHLSGKGCPSCGLIKLGRIGQDVSLEEYTKAKAEGKRYCKVHGIQCLEKFWINRNPKGGSSYACKECRRAMGTPPNTLARIKDRAREIRLEVMRHYSNGTLSCEICKESHYEFLALDHINGNGAWHRQKQREEGGSYWESFKKKSWPKGFRVLCHNCNLKHGCRDRFMNGMRVISTILLSRKLRNRKGHFKLKAEVMGHYGGCKCICCGIDDLVVLSMDHIGGGGNAHRKLLKEKGERYNLHWFKKNDYPSGFQVLCMNCNAAKGRRGSDGLCPHEREQDSVVSPSEGTASFPQL